MELPQSCEFAAESRNTVQRSRRWKGYDGVPTRLQHIKVRPDGLESYFGRKVLDQTDAEYNVGLYRQGERRHVLFMELDVEPR
jgi:hypothetical protein